MGLISNPQPRGSWTAPVFAGPNGATDVLVAGSVLSGSKLYVGGRFTMVDGQPRMCLACIDTITGTVTDWSPTILTENSSNLFLDGGNCEVLAVAIGIVWVNIYHPSGNVTDAAGTSHAPFLAGFDVNTGAWVTPDFQPDASFYGGVATANFVYIDQLNGFLYIGGYFDAVMNFSTYGLVRLQIYSGYAADQTFVAGITPADAYSGSVWGMIPDPNNPALFIIWGDFTQIVDQDTRGAVVACTGMTQIAQSNGYYHSSIAFNFNIADPFSGFSTPYVYRLILNADGSFYIGGTFTQVASSVATFVDKLLPVTYLPDPSFIDPGFSPVNDYFGNMFLTTDGLALSGDFFYGTGPDLSGYRAIFLDFNGGILQQGLSGDGLFADNLIFVYNVAFEPKVGDMFIFGLNNTATYWYHRKFDAFRRAYPPFHLP